MMRFCVLISAICILASSGANAQWLETTFGVPDSFHGPQEPWSVVLAGGAAYVGDAEGRAIMSIDVERGFVRRQRIFTGRDYHTLCRNPVDDKVYCTAYNSGVLLAIDPATDSIRARVSLPGRPIAAMWSPVGNKVYVSDYGASLVHVVDGAGDTLLASIPVRTLPRRLVLAPELGKVYAALEGSSSIAVIDAAGDSLLKSFRIASLPRPLAWCPAERKVYVGTTGLLAVLDAVTDTVLRYVAVGGAVKLCYNPLRNTMYCFTGYSCHIVDCATDSVLAEVDGESDGVFFGPGSRIYAAGEPLRVFDATADTLLRELDVGGELLDVDTLAGRVIAAGDYRSVWLVDATTDTVAGWVTTTDRPVDIACDVAAAKAYCLDESGTITVIDCATNRILGTAQARGRMYRCAVAGSRGRLYCSSAGFRPRYRKSLSVLDTGRDSLVAEVPMPVVAGRFAYNPVGRRLFCASSSSADSLVVVVDVDADTVVGIVELFNPGGVVLAVDTIDNAVYCGHSGLSSMFVLDGTTGAIRRLVDIGHRSAALVWSWRENKLYSLGGPGDSSIVVIDCGRNQVIAKIPAPDRAWRDLGCYDGRLNRAFFLTGGHIMSVDCRTDSLSHALAPVGGAVGISCDTAFGRLYVARDYGSREVVVFDCSTLEVVGRVGLDAVPDAQAWNPEWKRLYTANGSDMSVSVVRDSLVVGLAAEPRPASGFPCPAPTIVRSVLRLRDCHPVSGTETGGCTPPVLLDATGRRVMELQPGENDIRHLAGGVYFVRGQGSRDQGFEGSRVSKVVVTK